MKLGTLSVNRRGSGSEQYPPRMMLALVIYSYANGVFGSRRIERSTYRDIAVRYLTGDTHPDHDTICAFRRENDTAIREAFLEVLKLAREMNLLKVGTISVDGTHIKASASKNKSVRYDRAGELEQKLRQDIAELMGQAERSDLEGKPDEQALPQEIARREKLLQRMQEARRQLEQRARDKGRGSGPGAGDGGLDGGASGDEEPTPEPKDSQQINLTDPDSCLMRKSKRDSYVQAYNAQAVVDADGSQLIIALDVLQTPCDANHLEAAVRSVPSTIGTVHRALADGGYINVEGFQRLEKGEEPVELFVAVTGEDRERRYDYRPPRQRPRKKVTDPRLVAMHEKVTSEEGRRIYAKRARTVEPVFGIIKEAMGFRQFLLRGVRKVKTEWALVCLAYNLKRLAALAGV